MTQMLQVEIARRIEGEILNGTFGPGAKLPTEAQLALRYRVSRNVIREAVARLRSDGLVWSRQGRGMFVTDLPEALIFRFDAAALSRGAELARLFELRMEIEAGAAAHAAARRSPAQLRAIEAALSRFHQSIVTKEERVAADAAFHTAIARAAGNHFFFDFVRILNFCISRNAAYVRATSPGHKDWMASVVTEHAMIVEQISAADALGARAAVRAHLTNAMRRSGIARHLNRAGAARQRTATTSREWSC